MNIRNLIIPVTALALASCMVGPDYQKPDTSAITPAHWKWRSASPRDTQSKEKWWTVFGDGELNRIESQAVHNNQELRAALARFDQGRAYTRASAAAFVPTLTAQGAASRQRTSANQPTPIPFAIPTAQLNTFTTPLDLTYEIDIWGRIRRSVESARADTDSLAAAYQTVLLSLTSDVASYYFQVRACDAEIAALEKTISTREKSLKLIDQRAKAGATNEIDSARARSELASTAAEIADVKRQRDELVGGIALLCGQPATRFSLSHRESTISPPSIPAGIPANVLERRPDIASAERNVAARNAEIGANIAGYFPAISLTGQGGYLSKDTATLFSSQSKVWSIGAGAMQPITGYFTTKAKVERARAAHDEAVAKYREAVLAAIRDVETSLGRIHYRREQANAQDAALNSAHRANDLIRANYEAGTITYLDLLESDRTCILQERQSARLHALQLVDTVSLIKALGGKW